MAEVSAPSLITLDEVRLPREADGDPLYGAERSEYDQAHLRARQELELQGLQEDLENRKRYAGRIFYLLAAWIAAIFALVVADGVGWIEVSDAVLIALISGTTLNVIALFAIVARYLFPKR